MKLALIKKVAIDLDGRLVDNHSMYSMLSVQDQHTLVSSTTSSLGSYSVKAPRFHTEAPPTAGVKRCSWHHGVVPTVPLPGAKCTDGAIYRGL